MGTAWTYAKDVAQDHVAIRTKAGSDGRVGPEEAVPRRAACLGRC